MTERVEAIAYSIPFRRPFVTSRIVHHSREGLLLRVRDGDDLGVGEASPPPTLGRAGVVDAIAALEAGAGGHPPWLGLGLEAARLDLSGRRSGRQVARLLSERPRESVAVNATLRSVEPGDAADQAAAARAAGIRTVKLKVAVGAIADDLRRVSAVRDAVGADVSIRVDANGGWSEAEAAQALDALAPLGIEYVEQPLDAEDLVGLARLRSRVRVPIAVDEAVRDVASVERVIVVRAADVLIIKPARVGGWKATRDIAALAHASGLGIVLTTTLDSSVGIAAALHFAAALPFELRACGLATASLLAGDVTMSTPVVRAGAMEVPAGAGLGVELDDDMLERWRR